MGIKANGQYDFSVIARQNKESNVLKAELVNLEVLCINSFTRDFLQTI